jgi:hypothetical protein
VQFDGMWKLDSKINSRFTDQSRCIDELVLLTNDCSRDEFFHDGERNTFCIRLIDTVVEKRIAGPRGRCSTPLHQIRYGQLASTGHASIQMIRCTRTTPADDVRGILSDRNMHIKCVGDGLSFAAARTTHDAMKLK